MYNRALDPIVFVKMQSKFGFEGGNEDGLMRFEPCSRLWQMPLARALGHLDF